MPRYRVECAMEVTADYQREAAELVRRELREPSVWETLFLVVDVNDETETPTCIDFSKD